MTVKQFGTKLFNADSEAEVFQILKEARNDYNIDWVPIGDIEGNYAIAESQASAPLDAFTELISNSIDATFRRCYRENYDEPRSASFDPDTGLTNYRDAAGELLTGDEEIQIVSSGERSDRGEDETPPNLLISDKGEGQLPEDFTETFVGMFKPGQAKKGWPFLQGQFGMGSSGVLPHCGERGYKFIATAAMERPKTWTWTITRKNREGNTYDYLIIDGKPPVFEGEFNGQSTGTSIKLYNYKLKNHGQITSTFRNWLDRTVVWSPVPLKIIEDRDYKSEVLEITTAGLLSRLENDHSHFYQQKKNIQHDFGGILGKRDILVYVFKQDKKIAEEYGEKAKRYKQRYYTSAPKQRERAVFFTVNGQVHGDQGYTFIENRCKKYQIGRDAMVFVDFSDLGPQDLVELFKPSRDRLADKETAREFLEELESLLKDDEMLVDIEQRRKQETVKSRTEEKTWDILNSQLRRNPQLKRLLLSGERVQTGDVAGKEKFEYTAPFIPDEFKIIKKLQGRSDYELWDESKGTYKKRIPANRNGWVNFKLNAQNNYFDRADMSGEWSATPSDVVETQSFADGLFRLQLRPLENIESGDSLPITVKITRPSKPPLEQSFKLVYVDPVSQQEKESGEESDPRDERFDPPPMHPVTEDEWEDYGWGEHDIVRVDDYDESIELYYNIDAAPLRSFYQRNNIRPKGKEFVEEVWETGIMIYTLAAYYELRQGYSDNGVSPREAASVSMRGVAQTMLDQHISEDDMDWITA